MSRKHFVLMAAIGAVWSGTALVVAMWPRPAELPASIAPDKLVQLAQEKGLYAYSNRKDGVLLDTVAVSNRDLVWEEIAEVRPDGLSNGSGLLVAIFSKGRYVPADASAWLWGECLVMGDEAVLLQLTDGRPLPAANQAASPQE